MDDLVWVGCPSCQCAIVFAGTFAVPGYPGMVTAPGIVERHSMVSSKPGWRNELEGSSAGGRVAVHARMPPR